MPINHVFISLTKIIPDLLTVGDTDALTSYLDLLTSLSATLSQQDL